MPGATILDSDVTLLKAGVATGPNKAGGSAWPGVAALASYTWTGADLAGFSPSDINNANFGVQVSASSSVVTSAQVDYIQITITYSTGAGAMMMTGAGQ